MFWLHEQMSQNVAKLNSKARTEYIEQNILFKTTTDIAKDCLVSRRTIERDITKWKAKGGFDRFLDREFFSLYSQEKLTNPSRALDRVITLMMRRVPEIENKLEQPTKLVIEIVDPKSPNKIYTP
jgi:hypothetical protein